MANVYIVGFGAGIASALLFAVTATLTPLAVFLSYAAPLPIVIAALGWTHWTGLFALAIGGVALSFTLGSTLAIGYAIGVAAPAWALSALALVRRVDADGQPHWASLGLVLFGSIVVAGLITLISAITIGGGAYDTYARAMRQVIETMIRVQMNLPDGAAPTLGTGVNTELVIESIVGFFPLAIGASIVPLFIANLWAGAKVVAVSGRLPRPWVPMFATRLPTATLPILIVALLASMLGAFPGVLAKGLVGAGIAALGLQGLAAIHARTQGKASRPLVLGGLYAVLIVTLGWAMPFLAVIGVFDMLTARRGGGQTPTHY